MSGSGAAQKGTSLRELLDQYVDAKRLDVKPYPSGHLSESKLLWLPDQAPHSLWTGHNRSPVTLQTLSGTGISAKSQTEVKKDTLIHDAQMKQHYKLKSLKSKDVPKFPETADYKHIAESRQVLSSLELQGVCRVSLDNHTLVEELCLPPQMDSKQKNAKISDFTFTTDLQKPGTGASIPSVVPAHFKVATKKEQFRKIRDYHKNVIQHQTYAHQHPITGSDAVKYLEHRLQEVKF